MAEAAGEASDRKWKFAVSFMIAGLMSAGFAVMLIPTFVSLLKQVPSGSIDYIWTGAGIALVSAVVAFVYGFIPRAPVGIAALAIHLVAVGFFVASKAGACSALAGLILTGRGAYQLYRAEKLRQTQVAVSSPPPPPLSPTA